MQIALSECDQSQVNDSVFSLKTERIGHGVQNVPNGAQSVDIVFRLVSRQELEISSVYHCQDVSWSFSMAGIPHQRERPRSLHFLLFTKVPSTA